MNRELFISAETFAEHRNEITAAVTLLLQNPKSRRNFELTAIYTKKTGELLARALSTQYGIVMVLESWIAPDAWNAIQTKERPELPRREFVRNSEPVRMVLPLPSDPDGEVVLSAKSRREPFIVTAEDIMRRIGNAPYPDGREFRLTDDLTFG
ncbi:MAG: hypothetical protein R2763_17285 [Mycobacterium sp.]